MKQKKVSLKWGMLTIILVCWMAAMIIVITCAGILVNKHYANAQAQQAGTDAEEVLEQIGFRLSDSMESSKKISYDGVIRNAYQQFLTDQDDIAMYRTSTQYLSTNFSRDAKFEAVFISFWNPQVTSRLYVINKKDNSYHILQQFIAQVRPLVMEMMQNADTDIRFLEESGDLYMCRNLLDAKFQPYATVTMLCDRTVLLQPLLSLASRMELVLAIDDMLLKIDGFGHVQSYSEQDIHSKHTDSYRSEVGGHTVGLDVTPEIFDIWKDMPELRQAVILACFFVIPILGLMILAFYKTVSQPVRELVEASHKVQEGERGYLIKGDANSKEFETLYQQFNNMSKELQRQFEQSKMEQQALQQAKIKALQSQINPHFLNNTLEVINWEARMAGNDNVSEMIDALSTMMDAALDRDETGRVPLSQELKYVDAYLTIIQKRLGNRFRVEHTIDENVLDVYVPRLILQPIIENAVEHDITPKKGGQLCVSARKDDTHLILEVVHEGHMTQEDMQHIRDILSEVDLKDIRQERGRHVGLRNVAMRLKLLYQEGSSLTIKQSGEEQVSAIVKLPLAMRRI